jgi:hypothetical protein
MQTAVQHKLTNRLWERLIRDSGQCCAEWGNEMILFWIPLGLSVGATVFMLMNDDFGKVAKAFAVALTGGAILFTFVPALRIHFFVPLAMQLIVCFWVALYLQIQR